MICFVGSKSEDWGGKCMAFKRLDSVDWNDPVAQLVLLAAERPLEFWRISKDLRGGRTKGALGRYCVLVQNYIKDNPDEAGAELHRLRTVGMPGQRNYDMVEAA